MGGFSEYRRKKATMLSAAKRLRVEDRGGQERRSARVGRGAEDGTVASDRGLPTRGWQVSVTEPVAGSRRGLSRPLVAGEPIMKKSDRREATSDRRRAGGYGAADGAPIAWDAADDLPMHPRTRGRSSAAASSSSAFPSCAALVTGVALMMMVAVCALAVVHPELARAGATHAAAAWTGRVSSFVSSFRRETVDTQSARLAFLAPHGHDGRHRHAQKTAAKMGPGCELLSVEEAAASVAAAFAKGESSIGAACEAAKQFRWDDVDPYVDAAAKDRVGGNEDEGKVVVFHAGSRFDPDAVTRAAEMMARDDEVDPKVSPGEGSAGAEKRKEKSGAAHVGKKEKSGAAHEGKKENALPLPGGGDEPPPRPTGNLTAPPAPPAPPRPVPALRDSSTAKSKKGAGLGEERLPGSNGGVFGVLRGLMRRRETSEERAFRAWQKKHDTGEVGAATAARRLLAVPGRDGRSKTTKSRSKDRGEGSEGGWTCVIVGENARVAQKISRAVADVGLPCASVVNRANKTRDGANVRGEECEVKRARAADVKLMSRARHVVATEHNDGAHVAALLRRCARDAA